MMSSSPPQPPSLPDSGQGTEPQPAPIEFYGGYQVYSESGVDLTLLRENLRRTVTERLRNNSRGLQMIRAVDESRLASNPKQETPRRSSAMLQDENILRALVEKRIDFVLIGGLAMRAQGSAYITEDLDICYSRTKDNIAALAEALAPFHSYMRGAPRGLPFRLDPPTIQAGLNFTLTTDLGDIDILGEVSGLGNYEKVLASSEERVMYGLKIKVLSIDGLIAAKKAARRRKDQDHLLELLELKKLRDAAK